MSLSTIEPTPIRTAFSTEPFAGFDVHLGGYQAVTSLCMQNYAGGAPTCRTDLERTTWEGFSKFARRNAQCLTWPVRQVTREPVTRRPRIKEGLRV